MQVHRDDDRETLPGTAEYFTGEVTRREIAGADEHSALSSGEVTFAAKARTNWHTHPVGQTLLITSGTAWVQAEGGPKMELNPGDVVRFSPGERHWHGASPDGPMTHVTMQEAQNGSFVDWAEPVSDADYAG